MKVPQFMPWVGQEEYKAIASCFEKNWITEGPKAKELSEKLLELIGAKYGIFAPNGTLALYLGLKSMGIGPEDEVIVPDFTFIASANAVQMVGAKPIFVDVNSRNFQMDLSQADHLINVHTKAIMPVHIYGTIADMDTICSFAKQHKLLIIEDAAQAIGVHYKGKHAGTFGHTGTFSFFADKTLTTAEGGFVVTDDEKIYEQLLYLRNQGRKDRGSFIHPHIGYNFRMTDMQCAVGLVQLDKLDEIIRRKLNATRRYKELLQETSQVKFFAPDPEVEWIPFRIGILCEKSSDLMEFMKSKEIEPRTFFYPLHRQPAFAYLKKDPALSSRFNDETFPNAVYAYDHGICLPTFPTIEEVQIQHVCATIKEFYA